MLLLSTTNKLCEDVSPFPLLLILPMLVYLLTYIIGFSSLVDNNSRFLVYLYLAGLLMSLGIHVYGECVGLLSLVLMFMFVLFAVCMFCHSSIYALRPAAKSLTSFYLMVAFGGMLGSAFASILAPFIFKGSWEYFITLAISSFLFVWHHSSLNSGMPFRAKNYLLYVVPLLMLVLCREEITKITSDIVEMSRNFYGTLSVCKQVKVRGDQIVNVFALKHGRITHGMQPDRGSYRYRPTSYFTEPSGIGIAILQHPKYLRHEPLRIGCIGLGIGTLASYGRSGDYIRFYEINPDVVRYARDNRYFSYLSDSLAKIDVVIADGRLALERELSEEESRKYDVFVLDAFNGDAVPMHLLTKEAFDIYWQHLNSDGIIAMQMTNRYIDFVPLAVALSKYYRALFALIATKGDGKVSADACWMLISRNKEFMESKVVRNAAKRNNGATTPVRIWTDDFGNVCLLVKKFTGQ